MKRVTLATTIAQELGLAALLTGSLLLFGAQYLIPEAYVRVITSLVGLALVPAGMVVLGTAAIADYQRYRRAAHVRERVFIQKLSPSIERPPLAN